MQNQKPRPSPGQFFKERSWENAKPAPSLRAKDIERIRGVAQRLHRKGCWDAMPTLLPFIGLKQPDTPGASYWSGPEIQLLFSIAMRSPHPLIQEALESKGKYLPKDFLVKLMNEKFLSGMRILDLGCGKNAIFARCARRLGAEAYTVDHSPAAEFISNWEPRMRVKEISQHICLGMKEPDAFFRIMRATSGGFDLISSSCLGSDRDLVYSQDSLTDFISPLLAKGGLILNCDSMLIGSYVYFREGRQFARVALEELPARRDNQQF